MKKIIPALLLFLLIAISSSAQNDYRIVFDITSKDTVDHRLLLRWINEVSKPNPDAILEIVYYGQSLGMVVKDRSTVAEEVMRLASNPNIRFRVCAIALKNQQVDKSQLLPGIETVPDGIYEIFLRQKEGYGYIKVSH